MYSTHGSAATLFQPLAHAGEQGWEAQSEVFWELFTVFAGLGTVVGVIVVAYMLYNVYKYRDGSGEGEEEDLVVGEIMTGKGKTKTKKLAISLSLSALIVIALIVYAYTALLYVEAGPDVEEESEMNVDVEGFQFGWSFEYPNGYETTGELRIPKDTVVRLNVTSRDVWHQFGISELKVKSDSIPGKTTETWMSVNETGTYLIECYELCGAAHSQMVADLVVMEEDEFDEWYEEKSAEVDDQEDEQDHQEETETEQSGGGGH